MIARPTELLMDTCALIWFASGTGLKGVAIDLIMEAARGGNAVVSAASAWEIGLIARKPSSDPGKPVFEPNAETWFFTAIERSQFRVVSLSAEIMVRASSLPETFHNDPADRLIVATARRLNIPVVTRDRKILDYADSGHVAAIAC